MFGGEVVVGCFVDVVVDVGGGDGMCFVGVVELGE